MTNKNDICVQLERILSDSPVRENARCGQFLRYVVEETLAGRSDRIKGYSIAVSALGRPESFDAQGDPIVRVLAGRLRSQLQIYYAQSGQNDQVVISIPKGGYVPEFALKSNQATEPDARSFRETSPALATHTIGSKFSWLPNHCRMVGTILSTLLVTDCALRIVELTGY